VASITRASRAQRVDKQLQVERALLRATEQLLDSGLSFTELSVEQLSRQAGIARSTFYIYFADKGALVQRLAARVTEELMEACNGWWRIADTARQDDLGDAMLDVLDVYDRHRSVMRALVETSSYDADSEKAFKELLGGVLKGSRVAHDRILDAGRLREGVAREVAEALTLMVDAVCYQLGRGATPQRRRALAQALAHVVWHTMYEPDKKSHK
jgi:AcrR family transcriptional regulator